MAVSTPNMYPVRLTPEQRSSFLEITRNGHAPVKKVRHVRVLLWSDLESESGRESSRLSRVIGERFEDARQYGGPHSQAVRLKLLAEERKRKGLVTGVCAETVRKTLKKMSCRLGVSNAGVFQSGTRLGLSPRWKTSSTSTQPTTRRKNR